MTRENHILFLTLPPHTSHKLQPLDQTVFGTYKTFYNQAVKEWMVENRRPITIYNIGGCITKAYGRAFSVQNITKGFQVTGICPLNEGIFGDDEFLPSYVTDRPYNTLMTQPKVQLKLDHNLARLMNLMKHIHIPQPTLINPRHNIGLVNSIVSPEDIRPFPKAPERKLNATRKGRKKGRTRILTDIPEKDEVELNKKPKTLTKPKINLVKKKCIRKKLKFVTIDENSEKDCENHKIMNDDDSDDIINEVEEMEKYQREDDYLLRTKIKQGDFILIKVKAKKRCLHYVAEIVDVVGSNYIINYFHKTSSNKFIDGKEDHDEVTDNEIAR
ncbi:unnamed protein product [Macrosiphum euphorbiae]|uniref:DDE-1 domain-containing protein n=1 Tax=Macrosiphum euphorbiae TaxID=13131 RepID=A0AAV0WSC5_9HEMI|nr:unnamed protein product [Macrosiphum euphorbiae]